MSTLEVANTFTVDDSADPHWAVMVGELQDVARWGRLRARAPDHIGSIRCAATDAEDTPGQHRGSADRPADQTGAPLQQRSTVRHRGLASVKPNCERADVARTEAASCSAVQPRR